MVQWLSYTESSFQSIASSATVVAFSHWVGSALLRLERCKGLALKPSGSRTPVAPKLKRIVQIKLLPLENWLNLARRHPRSKDRVLQIAVQRASQEELVVCGNVATQLPTCINFVLQNIGWRALIALRPRSEDGILFRAPVGVAKLKITLILELTNAEVTQVRITLRSNAGNHIPSGVERVACCIQVLFILDHNIEREACQSGLDLVVKNEVGIFEAREKMRFAGCVSESCVGQSIRRKSARWGGRQTESSGTARTLPGDLNASVASGRLQGKGRGR